MTDKTFSFAAGPEEWQAGNVDTTHSTGTMCAENGFWQNTNLAWNPIYTQYEVMAIIQSTHRFSGTWLDIFTGDNGPNAEYTGLFMQRKVRGWVECADDPDGPWDGNLAQGVFSAHCDNVHLDIVDYPQKYWRVIVQSLAPASSGVYATISKIQITDFVDHDALPPGAGNAYHIARTPNAGGTWQSVEQTWGAAHCASLKPVGNEIVAIKQGESDLGWTFDTDADGWTLEPAAAWDGTVGHTDPGCIKMPMTNSLTQVMAITLPTIEVMDTLRIWYRFTSSSPGSGNQVYISYEVDGEPGYGPMTELTADTGWLSWDTVLTSDWSGQTLIIKVSGDGSASGSDVFLDDISFLSTMIDDYSLYRGSSELTKQSDLPFGLATPDAMAVSDQGLIAIGANAPQAGGEMILVSGDGVNWQTPEGARYHGLQSEITSLRWLKPCVPNFGRPTGGIQIPTDTGQVVEIPPGDPGTVLQPGEPGQPLSWGRLNLDDLGDVDTTTTPPQDGDGLVYDSATGQWVPTQVAASVDWADITNKPATFPPETHGHDWGEVTGKPDTFPPSSHQHAWGDITGEPPIPYVLDDLNDVAASTPNDGQALKWSDASGAWVPGTPTIPYASQVAAGTVEIATNAEVQTGTDTARMVTPAGLRACTATDARPGVIELATAAEVQAGTDTTRAVTPDTLNACTATTTRLGVIELATQAEVNAGTDATRAVVSSTLKAFLDSNIGRGTRVDYSAGTQAVTANVNKVISFNRAIQDNLGMWVAGAPTRLTVPTGLGGWYVIFGCAQFSPGTTGTNRYLAIYHNNTSTIAIQVQAPRPGGVSITIAVSTLWYLNAGDFVELLFGSDVNGTIDMAWAYTPAFAAVRIRA